MRHDAAKARKVIHELTARGVLARHERVTGTPAGLPVPIEAIVERTYDLEVVYDGLKEPPDAFVLGALIPSEKRIILNERHIDMFERWVGPERFTLAHELAHWMNDARVSAKPTPGRMDGEQETPSFCYHRKSPGLTDELRVCEAKANQLAASILLPAHLMRSIDVKAVLNDFRGTAERWGVSQKTLGYRLIDLELAEGHEVFPRRSGRR